MAPTHLATDRRRITSARRGDAVQAVRFAERAVEAVEKDMMIIAGHTLTNAAGRDAAVAAHAEVVRRARRHDGCLGLSISADSVDPERINIFELWRDQAALDAWRAVAHPPQVERRETHVSLYRTQKAESPF